MTCSRTAAGSRPRSRFAVCGLLVTRRQRVHGSRGYSGAWDLKCELCFGMGCMSTCNGRADGVAQALDGCQPLEWRAGFQVARDAVFGSRRLTSRQKDWDAKPAESACTQSAGRGATTARPLDAGARPLDAVDGDGVLWSVSNRRLGALKMQLCGTRRRAAQSPDGPRELLRKLTTLPNHPSRVPVRRRA